MAKKSKDDLVLASLVNIEKTMKDINNEMRIVRGRLASLENWAAKADPRRDIMVKHNKTLEIEMDNGEVE